jgi:hypothetical protein
MGILCVVETSSDEKLKFYTRIDIETTASYTQDFIRTVDLKGREPP